MSVLVGSERVVTSAVKHIPRDELINALPYINYARLSSETTRLLKLNEKLLPEIIDNLKKQLGVKEIEKVRLMRFKLSS
jgi:hypothetical protein